MKFRNIVLIFSAIFLNCVALANGDWDQLSQGLNQQRYEDHLKVLTGEVEWNGWIIRDRFSPEHMQRARSYFMDVFRRAGFSQVQVEKFDLKTQRSSTYESRRPTHGENYFVEIKGRSRPNEVVVIGAHYDTTDFNHPGANDNGSGVAAVLSMAQAFMEAGIQPERTIRFVLFDTEELYGKEWGKETYLEGSQYNMDRSLVNGEIIKLFVNLDMIGHSPSGLKHVLYDDSRFPSIGALIHEVNRENRHQFSVGYWRPYESDQNSGSMRGIPSVSIFEDPRDRNGEEVEYDPENHSRNDRYRRVNTGYASSISRLVGNILLAAVNSERSFDTHEMWRLQERERQLARNRIQDVSAYTVRLDQDIPDAKSKIMGASSTFSIWKDGLLEKYNFVALIQKDLEGKETLRVSVVPLNVENAKIKVAMTYSLNSKKSLENGTEYVFSHLNIEGKESIIEVFVPTQEGLSPRVQMFQFKSLLANNVEGAENKVFSSGNKESANRLMSLLEGLNVLAGVAKPEDVRRIDEAIRALSDIKFAEKGMWSKIAQTTFLLRMESTSRMMRNR